MPLRSSRKNTRNRVRVFENRRPYDPVKARRSFQKFKTDLSTKISHFRRGGKIPARQRESTLGSTWVSTPSLGVDPGVDPLVGLCDLGAPFWLLGWVLVPCDEI